MAVRDIVIFTNSHALNDSLPQPTDAELEHLLSLRETRFFVTDDIWIGAIEQSLADQIMDACQPHGNQSVIRQYGQLYSFVRENPPLMNSPYHWDKDAQLQQCIVLSRLVRLTSIGFRFSARVFYNDDDTIREIIPGPVADLGASAWVISRTDRNFLTHEDLVRLKTLCSSLSLSNLPPRITRAMWHFEYAARTYYIELRWTHISIAFEALINTSKFDVTKQFKKRVSSLTKVVEGNLTFTEKDADLFYGKRSTIAHGQITDLTESEQKLYVAGETLLRRVLMKAIEDVNFANIFRTEDSIDAEWPIEKKKPPCAKFATCIDYAPQ